MQLIACPGCGENRGAGSLEDEQGFARCPDCAAVFLVGSDLGLDGSQGFRSERVAEPADCTTQLAESRRPRDGYRSASGGQATSGLTLTWRHRHPSPYFVFLIGLVMSVLTFLWIAVAVEKELPLYLVVALGSPFAMLALGFFYSFAVAGMNRMRLSLRRGMLVLAAGPLPMPSAYVRLDAKDIRDVYVRKTIVVSARPSRDHSVSAVYYELRVLLGSGEGLRLSQFRDVETALYVAQCVSDALGLATGPSDKLLETMQGFRALQREQRTR